MHVRSHNLVRVRRRGCHHFTEGADAHLTAAGQAHTHALALRISWDLGRERQQKLSNLQRASQLARCHLVYLGCMYLDAKAPRTSGQMILTTALILT